MPDRSESELAKDQLLSMTWPSPVDPTVFFDKLNEIHLAECLLKSAVTGNIHLMQALWDRRGPIDLQSLAVNEQGFHFLLDDVLCRANNIADVKKLFQAIHDCGIKGLIDAGSHYPEFFKSRHIVEPMALGREVLFKGYLPFLDGGVLRDPELAISLMQESQMSWAPQAYQPMLCLATEAMLAQFKGHLVPVHPLQQVEFTCPDYDCRPGGTPIVFHGPMAEFKEANRHPERAVIKRIRLGFEASPENSELLDQLLHYFCDTQLRAGFLPQGRVLCETRADFLVQFPQIPCEDYHNSSAARIFCRDYLPVDILSRQTLKACRQDFGYLEGDSSIPSLLKEPLAKCHDGYFSSLYDHLNCDTEMRQQLLQMMTPQQWRGLIVGSKSPVIWAESVIAFRDTLGMTNEGLQLVLLPEECYTFFAAGYRFKDDTKVFDSTEAFDAFTRQHPSETGVLIYASTDQIVSYLTREADRDCPDVEILEAAKDLHSVVQSMNLWSSEGLKPESVKSALDEICSTDIGKPESYHGLALFAYLRAHGIEACANCATTPMHWRRITELFSDTETLPYLKQMPREARGRVLEQGLGL